MPSRQFESFIQMMRARPVDRSATVQQMREQFERITPLFGPLPADVQIASAELGGRACEWFTPMRLQTDGVMLYLHGGGYCIGSLTTHRHFTAMLASAASMRVVSLDYRLAPEHPFPAALEDAVAGYRGLTAQGLAAEQICIAGDSAGGGLTLATIGQLCADGDRLPGAGICLSPWTDLAITGMSVDGRAAIDPMIQPWELHAYARRYLNGTPARDPRVSPLYGDFEGYPPILLHVGSAEILLDDSTRLHERLRAANVDVTYHLAPDMIHVWHFFAPLIPEGETGVDDIARFIRRYFS